MTAEQVEAVIETLSHKDPDLGSWAQAASDALTAGEGEEVISQASLQHWLWYYLPKKSDEESWQPMVQAAAVLLDELGLDRYARIARSQDTAEVLGAWRSGRSKGFARFKAAADTSGVEPMDTELLVWGDVMGVDEVTASAHVERSLERAILDGRLKPGTRGWRQIAVAVCEESLVEPVQDVPTQTWLTLVITERVGSWVDAGRPDRLREMRQAVANHLLAPPEPPPPAEIEAVLAPMRWLLEACHEGVELTHAGYLPTRLVAESIERFFQRDAIIGRPRSEVDVYRLTMLRETAARLGWITRRHRRLKTTAAGIRAVGDPIEMWRRMTANLDEGDSFSKMLSELIAHRLLQGPALGDDLASVITPILSAQGWRAGTVPIGEEQARASIHGPLRIWRLFGLLDEQVPRWENGRPLGQRVTALTDPGERAAWWFLHARATAPRPHPFGG